MRVRQRDLSARLRAKEDRVPRVVGPRRGVAVGAHASGGWIATNLVNYRTYPYGEWPSGVAIGLLLVFNLTGHVRQCTVNGVDGFGPFPNLGYDQVKPVDPETFVLGRTRTARASASLASGGGARASSRRSAPSSTTATTSRRGGARRTSNTRATTTACARRSRRLLGDLQLLQDGDRERRGRDPRARER